MSSNILIVEDDRQQRRYLAAVLTSAGHKVEAVANAESAMTRLMDAEAPPMQLCLLDLHMPAIDGLALLKRLRAAGHTLPVIVLTGDGSVARAVDAMRAGANDFLVKPIGPERLEVSIRNVLEISTLSSDVRRLSREEGQALGFDDLVAQSASFRDAIKLANRSAQSDIPVLLTGESGSGKEVFARAVHGASNRADMPFVAVNCGALRDGTVDAVLFGHEKGAFSGATERRSGKFQEASGGTLFLDEIGELPAAAQVKLLRALQQREIEPLGAAKPVGVDIRLVSASNQDLAGMVADGRFREDLYYRISAFPIHLPPLRERREDLLMLAQMFLTRFAAAEGMRITGFSEDAAQLIESADWPGNVRQLQNTVHRAVVLAEGPVIRAEHLVGIETTCRTGSVAADAAARDALVDEDGQIRKLAEIEAEAIQRALTIYHGRMAEVARRLGIGRSTLYRKLEELNLSRRRA
ncbi:MAG: sigma-54 dependent transcriptional regulator [Pseudomonadota bacterium]